jgi:hypothetical protein
MRHDDAQRAGVEHTACAIGIVAGQAHQRRDAALQRCDADLRRIGLGQRRVFEIEIDRVEAAAGRGHGDLDAARMAVDHRQAQAAGTQRLGQRIAQRRGHAHGIEAAWAGGAAGASTRSAGGIGSPRRKRTMLPNAWRAT